jgi:D-alanyl-D-alanine dipeptidase
MEPLLRSVALLLAVVVSQVPTWPREADQPNAPKPAAATAEQRALIGEYGTADSPIYVREQGGRLEAIVGRGAPQPVTSASFLTVDATRGPMRVLSLNGINYSRRDVGPADGGQLHITPVRPVPELLKEALTQAPPKESGDFYPADLVELTTLDPTIHLDIRYATTNNFLGSVFYSEARAFMQRPAAEAVARAAKALRPLGYGLLVHDGYRPWYVTKTFWDATPQDTKWLVADPSKGSKHNRGCAVDITLYDLATGKVIEMPSTYDESTPRAYAFYPGGTSLERWHRALLRRVMEAEGFAVNPEEWWHFDHQEWQHYAIGNVTFDQIRRSEKTEPPIE